MFYNEEEKNQIKEKWKNVFMNNCKICNGEGYFKRDGINEQCECMKRAIKYYKLEIANIPMQNIKVKKEDFEKYIKYDFKNYFDIISKNVFNTKNIFLYNLNIELNDMIITYIAKNLINKENILTKQKIKIQYTTFDDLVQFSLHSNNDKESRNKLNYLVNKIDVLFIDNVGLETGFGNNSKHNVKLLQTIMKGRNNKLKCTIICSKLYFQDIERFYNKEIVEMFTKYDIIKGE